MKVDVNLRVAGFPNFFALGDINDVKEEKLVSTCGQLAGCDQYFLDVQGGARLMLVPQ